MIPLARRPLRGWLLVALILALTAPVCGIAFAEEPPDTAGVAEQAAPNALPQPRPAILAVKVNGKSVGDLFVRLALNGGDVYVEHADYARLDLGLGEPERVVRIDDTSFVSLASLEPRVEFEVDQRDLSLSIFARPDSTGVFQIPGNTGPTGAKFLDGGSAFFNYDLSAYRSPGAESTETALTHEIGFRKGRVLALSDFVWQRNDAFSDYRRVRTQVILDYRRSLRRITALDTAASAGPLGSTLPMMGASVAKDFSINPYFIRYPMPELAGTVLTASEVEIYQNGFLSRRFRLPPGQFNIADLPVSAVGAGSYDVVIRDAFGREASISNSFYLSQSLLRRGLHSYNYGLGLLRENSFGTDPEYGDPAFIGSHRYGLTNYLTLGANLEGSGDVQALGLTGGVRLGLAGVLNVGTAFGGDDVGQGAAGYLAYDYASTRFSTNLFLRAFSDGYSNLARQRMSDPSRLESTFRFSVRAARYTSLSLLLSRTNTTDDVANVRAGLTLSQRLSSMLNLVATYERQTKDAPGILRIEDDVFFAGLHFYLPSRLSVDVTHSSDHRSNRQTVTVRRNVPLQEGYGYRASLERSSVEGQDGDGLRPSLYFVRNGPLGTYRAEYDEAGGEQAWRVSTAGSLALVEGSLFASRPLRESFAVVRTANVKGVRVNFNGEPAGKTRRGGEVLVPNLRSYEVNKLSIEQEDVPLEYTAERLESEFIPAPRSGAVVDFGLQRLRAIYGKLLLRDGEEDAPLEHLALSIDGLKADLSWRSGLGGEFYLEGIPDGKHVLHGAGGGRVYRCLVDVPQTDESLIDLGEVFCETVP